MKTPEPVSQPATPPMAQPAPSNEAQTTGQTPGQSSEATPAHRQPATAPEANPEADPEANPEADPQLNSDLPDVLAKACGKQGLGADAIAAVQREVLDAVEAALQADEAARTQERAALLDELEERWGQQTQPALDAAAFAAQSFGFDDDDLDDLLDCGDPRVIIPALARAGQALRALDEDPSGGFAPGEGELPGAGGRMTAEAAQAELSRLAADRDHRLAFLNRAHPGHAAAKAQRARLVAAAAESQGRSMPGSADLHRRGGRAVG